MLSLKTLAALAAFLSTTTAASLLFRNTSPSDICYFVQGDGDIPTPATCLSNQGSLHGFIVSAGKKTTIKPAPKFDGAFTAVYLSSLSTGTRFEFKMNPDGHTFYDVDYELGMSSGTLGPADHRPDSKRARTVCKADLLAKPEYFKQGADGELSFVYKDDGAKEMADVTAFFHEADFTGYVTSQDNEFAWEVDTPDMEIVAY